MKKPIGVYGIHTVFELYQRLIYTEVKILKFNLKYVRYRYNGITRKSNIYRCSEYDRYKKWYKILYLRGLK